MALLTIFSFIVIMGGMEVPRALSDQEECRQSQRPLDTGKRVFLANGMWNLALATSHYPQVWKRKPDVVHNSNYKLYLTMRCDLMAAEDHPETMDLLTGSLIARIL